MNRSFKQIICVLPLFFLTLLLKAQDIDVRELPQSMTYPMDSLLRDWKAKNYIAIGKDCSTANENPHFSDSVYANRLSRIPAVMELTYNGVVKKYIDQYTERLRNQVSFMLAASNFYIPLFEEALDAYNLPMELKYLPVIESALRPGAVSRAGASGLWQFMLNTGKTYGLETNSLVDERRDPIKSTWAAARYLKDLYAIYKDWNLVIAAYNCGPGNINKAIHRGGGATDYWKIYNYLPRETQGYVPAFIAANYTMTYYCDHNICPMETDIPAYTDTIQINQSLHFKQISEVCGIPMEQLRSLNPQYKRDLIPGNTRSYTLRLPDSLITAFIDKQDSIYAYQAKELQNEQVLSQVTTPAATSSRRTARVTTHKIRSGETLSTIARRYGVTVSNLKRWNGLRNSNISAGRRLKIHK